MADIVERLRLESNGADDALSLAAAEIVRLRSELAKVRGECADVARRDAIACREAAEAARSEAGILWDLWRASAQTADRIEAAIRALP